MGAVHLDMVQMPTTTYDRCLEAFHCSSAMKAGGQLQRGQTDATRSWTHFESAIPPPGIYVLRL